MNPSTTFTTPWSIKGHRAIDTGACRNIGATLVAELLHHGTADYITGQFLAVDGGFSTKGL